MADFAKAKITELNGVELEFDYEYLLVPENFPFSDPSFAAANTKDAIVEAKSSGPPGPPGPPGPDGQSALRAEFNVSGVSSITVNHNFGVTPLDNVLQVSSSFNDLTYNSGQFNTLKFGTGLSVIGFPTKVDPSSYTRVDSSDKNSSTFTFSSPFTGEITLLG